MTSILGLAHFLPPEADVVGVRRPIFVERGGSSDLALGATQGALEQAGLGPADVDFLIFATMTPDVTFPGSACYLQDKLACGTVGALDIRGQCCGFLFGLMIADDFVSTGTYQRIVLAAAEVHSSGLDYSARGAAVAKLYGDAGSAVILGQTGNGAGLRSVICHTDGRQYDRFWCEYPASRQHPVRVNIENFRAGKHYPQIDFDTVQRFGIEHLPLAIDEALAAADRNRDQIDAFILSHILPQVVTDTASSIGAGKRLIHAGEVHGHLTAASLPVAMSEALASGRVGKGQTVCLAACGAGFTWGAAVLSL